MTTISKLESDTVIQQALSTVDEKQHTYCDKLHRIIVI